MKRGERNQSTGKKIFIYENGTCLLKTFRLSGLSSIGFRTQVTLHHPKITKKEKIENSKKGKVP